MSRMVIEGITQNITVPNRNANCDKMFFMGIDPHKCNGCNACVEHCPTSIIYGETGLAHKIAYTEACIHCGMCLMHCPFRAVYEKVSWLQEVKERIADKNTVVIAMADPSLRYTFAEAFGIEENPASKMISALHALGFDHCWDLAFAADVAVWEEGHEFAARLKENRDLPLFTSFCASWQRYAEIFYPDLLGHFSTVKSPTAINGRLSKTYAAEKYGYDPKNIYTVAITPCVAKKYEALRPELTYNGMRDIDANLTAREFIHLVREADIDCAKLPDCEIDSVMGESSGGATMFSVSGGVAESLLRYAQQLLTGERPDISDYAGLRGMGAIRECSVEIGGNKFLVAAVHGAKNFARICDEVRAGVSPYQLIEFMSCPGGCVGGGGQLLLSAR